MTGASPRSTVVAVGPVTAHDPAASARLLALLDTLFADAPVGLAFFDLELRYVRVNERLAEINGVPVADHIGRTVDDVLPEMDARVTEGFRRVLETGEPIVDVEVVGSTPRQPGLTRHWLASYYPVNGPDGGRIGLGAVVTETTDRKREEAERQRFVQLVERTGELIGMALPSGEAIYLNRAGRELVGLGEGAVEGIDMLDLIHGSDRERFEREVLPQVVERGSWTGEIELRGRPDPSPIPVLGDVFVTERDADGRPLMIAAVLRDLSARRRRERRERFLAEASELLQGSLDLDATLDRIAWLAVPELCDWCRVDLADGHGGWRAVAGAHADSSRLELAARLRDRYPPRPEAGFGVARVFQSGEAELYEDIGEQLLERAARDEEHLRLLRALGVRSAMVVPMTARGRSLGALTFANSESGRRFAPEDLALASELGRRAGIAVDNADLYRRAQRAAAEAGAAAAASERRASQLRGLADAALGINSAPTVELVLERVTEAARGLIGAHLAVSSVTVDESWAQSTNSVSLSDRYADWRDYEAPPDGSGIYALVCETNASVRKTQAELEAHPRWRAYGAEADAHPPLRGWLAAPFVAGDGRNLGLLQLSDRYEGDFTEEDESILVQLAQIASIAIESTRLSEERLRVARTLQRSLLPPGLPRVPGLDIAARYHAAGEANEVGGDFYDVFEVEGGWFVAVGDVCGKGADAAALTALARHTLRALVRERHPPSAMLRAVNDAILRQRSDGRFLTAAFALLEPNDAGFDMTLASAGHPPALVVRAGGAHELAGAPGTPLGLFDDPEVEDQRLALVRDDVVLFYTDGLTEGRAPKAILDVRSLAPRIAAAGGAPAWRILDLVDAAICAPTALRRDDTALLLLSVTG